MIFVDTSILHHALRRTPRTEEALRVLEENPGDYVITLVHNEIIYTSTLRSRTQLTLRYIDSMNSFCRYYTELKRTTLRRSPRRNQ